MVDFLTQMSSWRVLERRKIKKITEVVVYDIEKKRDDDSALTVALFI